MTFTLCTSEAIIRRAGANANTTITASAAALLEYCTTAEGLIVAETKTDWVSIYDDIQTNFKGVLTNTVAALAAMDVIEYDISSYDQAEAETMLDILWTKYRQGVDILKEASKREKIKNA